MPSDIKLLPDEIGTMSSNSSTRMMPASIQAVVTHIHIKKILNWCFTFI